jgi:AraC family transcriptional regulator
MKTQKLPLDAIADAVGVSRFHLSRAFTVGCAVAPYVRARRLTEAARTLTQDASDILAVALDTGYGSHEAFTRAFRVHFGVTPERLRARGDLDERDLMEAIRMDDKTLTASVAPVRIAREDALLVFGVEQRYHRNGNEKVSFGAMSPRRIACGAK